MTRARNSANLASHGNLFVDIANDRTGIGSVVPAQNLHVAGTTGFHADVTFTGDLYNATWDRSDNSLNLVDGARLKLGTSQDLELYHNGTNSHIRNNTGSLIINGSEIYLMSHQGNPETYFSAVANGAASLYHNNVKKFETTAYGTNTTGTTDTDGLVVSGVATVTTMNVTGVLTYDDVTSVDSIGIVTARDHINIVTDNKKLQIGASQDLALYHDGTNSRIHNTNTGSLIIRNEVQDGDVIIQGNDGGSNVSLLAFDTSETGMATLHGELNMRGTHRIKFNYNTGNGNFESFIGQRFTSNSFNFVINNQQNNIFIENDNVVFRGKNGQGDETLAQFQKGGASTLHYGGSAKIQTTSYGIDVTGTTGTDGLAVSGVSTAVRYDVNFVNAEIKLTTNQSSFTRYGRINHYHNNGTTEHNAIQFSPRNGATGRMMFYNLVGGSVTERLRIDGTDGIQPSAHIVPMTDSTYNLGSNGTRFANVYADTLYGNGANITNVDAATLDGVDGANYVRTNQNTTITSDLFIGGGAGGVTVNAGSDIRFTNGDWTGNVGSGTAKIQHHNNYLYIAGGSNGIIFREINDNRWIIDGSGHFLPGVDSTYDIGLTGTRVRNIYADTLYGDGSNLTGITQTTINSNADNRVVTGSGTANTLNAESNLTFDGSTLAATGAITATGTIETTGSELKITGAEPRLTFTDTDNNPDFQIWANAQKFAIYDSTNSATRLHINSSGKFGINIADNTAADLQVRTGSNGAGLLRIGGSNGNGVGIDITYSNSGATQTTFKQNYRATHASALMKFDAGYFTFHTGTGGTERVRIASDGDVNIKGGNLHVGNDGATANFTDSGSGNTKHIEIGATGGGDALLTTHASGYGIGYFGYHTGMDRLVVACDQGAGSNSIDLITTAGTSTGGSTDNLHNVNPRFQIRGNGGFRAEFTDSNEVHAISNYDHGNNNYTNRNGRTLHSNGTGWDGNESTDGSDPILVLSVANRAGNSDIGDAYGLQLHSESQDDNDYAPMIGWTCRSNSGNYNTTIAAIVAQKKGQAADHNWSSGALHFFTNKPSGINGGYMNDQADMSINENGYISTPRNPSFLAEHGHNSGNHKQKSELFSSFIRNFQHVRHNQGNCFNNSTGKFTAPIAGIYSFHIDFTMDGGAGSDDSAGCYFRVENNSTYYNRVHSSVRDFHSVDPNLHSTSTGFEVNASFHSIEKLAAGATVGWYFTDWDATNTRITTCFFSGYKVG